MTTNKCKLKKPTNILNFVNSTQNITNTFIKLIPHSRKIKYKIKLMKNYYYH